MRPTPPPPPITFDQIRAYPIGADQTPGTEKTIFIATSGGGYNVSVLTPGTVSDHDAPVVIALHGRGGTGEDAIREFGMIEFAEKHGCIVLAPSAHGGHWRDISGDVGQPSELKFFATLLDQVPRFGGDPNRIYVIGHSNGGGMTDYLAATFSDRIAAVVTGGASVGSLDIDLNYHSLPTPKRPISVLMFHGMHDEIAGYDMRTFTVSVPDAAAWWARQDHLNPVPRHTSIAGGKLLIDRYTGSNRAEVVLMTYPNMGHSWPTVEDRPTGTSFDDEMWSFLSKHHLGA